jgi:hypothetical protein
MVAGMRLSLHKKPRFLPSTAPTPAARVRDSLPPRPAGRSRWIFFVVAALLTATVAFAANRAVRAERHAGTAAVSRADDDTRAVLDERLHAHLKRLQTR